ncbi:MAG: 50S ribosomal protein L17, partial [Pseudomonadota bacterium]|nr:50S ribosomal protein L17 [Pseudomonadota bacterium]
RLVTLGKKGTLHARRQAYKFLNDHQLVQKLFDEIAPRFSERQGGYTRLIKSRIRFVDQAPMTFVRFVSGELKTKSPEDETVKTTQTETVEEQVKAAVEEELEATQAEETVVETDAETEETVAESAAAGVGDTPVDTEVSGTSEDAKSEEKAEK